MYRRLAAIVGALVLLLLCVAPATAPAAPGDPDDVATSADAEPADATDPAPGSARIGLEFLGASPTLDLPGQNYTFALTLAVPEGTSPTALQGRVSLPAYVTGGSIDVLQGEKVLSRTPVVNTPGAALTLPLTGAVVDDSTHSISFALRSHLRTDDFCEFDPNDMFRITAAALDFAGSPAAPRTVGDFLPPVLTGLTMYLPADPHPGEAAATVGLATAIVAQYASAPVEVRTRALARTTLRPPADPDPYHRQIVIGEDLPGGLALGGGGRYLTLGGTDLLTEAAFLTSEISRLAMASAAIPGPQEKAPQLPRDVQTLADIGVGDQQVTDIGWPTLAVGIDQTRLGRPVKDLRVQLQGTYTPPPTGTGGRVVVRIGDSVIDSWPADQNGTFDRWVSVPNALVNRYTELRVTVERGDSRTGCGQAYVSSLSLSSGGHLETKPADPAIPPGFGSLPQSLMPRTQLAWTRGDVPDVTRAVSLMTGLQRLSPTPLGIDVVGMGAVNRSRPAVLIAADGTGLPALPLPVTGDDKGRINVSYLNHQPAVTNVPRVMFGSLQMVSGDGVNMLVATSTEAPALLDQALDWLDADPGRWAGLHGIAMLTAAGDSPVFLAGPPTPPSRRAQLSTAAWVGLALALAVVVAAAVAAALHRRRRRTSGAVEPGVPADPVDDE